MLPYATSKLFETSFVKRPGASLVILSSAYVTL